MPTLSPPPGQPVVRLTTPSEIVRAIPHLLGFYPSESVVVLGLGGPRLRLRMTMRVDLPAPGSEAAVAEHIAARMLHEHLTACTVVVFAGSGPAAPPRSAVRSMSKGRNGRATLPGAELAFAIHDALLDAGLDVPEVLRADGGRWWSYVCERSCCPPGGLEIGSGPTSLLEVLRVAAGRPVFADRSELVASVARVDGEPTAELQAAIRARRGVVARRRGRAAGAARDLAALQALLVHDAGLTDDAGLTPSDPGETGAETSGQEATDPETPGTGRRKPGQKLGRPGRRTPTTRLSHPLAPTEPNPANLDDRNSEDPNPGNPDPGNPDPGNLDAGDPVAGPDRDAFPVWEPIVHSDTTVAFAAVALANLAVRDGSFPWTGGPLADAAAALWRELVRRVPAPYAAAPATLLGVAAYREGDGALADAYLRRALEDDPDYRMADLILTSIEHGIRPSEVAAALGLASPPPEQAPQPSPRGKSGPETGTRRAGEADAQ